MFLTSSNSPADSSETQGSCTIMFEECHCVYTRFHAGLVQKPQDILQDILFLFVFITCLSFVLVLVSISYHCHYGGCDLCNGLWMTIVAHLSLSSWCLRRILFCYLILVSIYTTCLHSSPFPDDDNRMSVETSESKSISVRVTYDILAIY